MTSSHDGESDGHGPAFVGLYVILLVRYLRFKRDELLRSLEAVGIIADRDPRPLFLDLLARP